MRNCLVVIIFGALGILSFVYAIGVRSSHGVGTVISAIVVGIIALLIALATAWPWIQRARAEKNQPKEENK